MKEEKVGQKEELELIDFDMELDNAPTTTNENNTPSGNIINETVITNEEIIPNENITTNVPINNVENQKNENLSKTEKFVDSMQNFVSIITEPAPVEKTSTFSEIFKKVGEAKKPLDKFKVLWSEKRTRALTCLIFWIVFMFLAITMIKTNITVTPSEDENNNIDTAISTLSKLDNYGYSIVITTPETVKAISGNYYKNRSLFNYEGQQYYVENNLYSKVNNNALEESDFALEIDLDNLSPATIAKILEKSEVLENTTNNEGIVTARSYKISASEILAYLYDTKTASDDEIKIDVRYTDNQISSLEINMQDITEIQPEEKRVAGIHIEYRFIGKITANDVAYDIAGLNMGQNTNNENNEGE